MGRLSQQPAQAAGGHGHEFAGRIEKMGPEAQAEGLLAIGVPGTTAALALLNDAVKKGGAFASSRVGGLSGAFIPVSEDLNISDSARHGHLCLEKLEAITSVCSVGLDMGRRRERRERAGAGHPEQREGANPVEAPSLR